MSTAENTPAPPPPADAPATPPTADAPDSPPTSDAPAQPAERAQPNETQAQPKEIIEAKDVARQLSQFNSPVYVCRDKVIRGRLDLKHLNVKPAVEIIGCEFLDGVDFRYVEFAQTVNLSQCTFRKSFNSGDEGESQTVYRKDLICNEAVFHAGAGLNGMRCEGSSFFHSAKFLSPDHKVDFSGASFAKALELNDAVFKGPATFNGMRCDVMGGFNRVRFEHEESKVDFIGVSSGKTLEFIEAVFRGGAIFNGCRFELAGLFVKARFENPEVDLDFSSSSFGKGLDFTEAYFAGGANFGGSISELGLFTKAVFDNRERAVIFYGASFAKQLSCVEAVFRGAADFGSVTCDAAYFDSARFENEEQTVGFRYANVAARLSCTSAVFAGNADFGNLKCQDGDFTGARFTNADRLADFGHASFGWNVICDSAEFAGEANFNGARCGGGGFFRDARFTNDFEGEPDRQIDFRYSQFGVNLQLDRAEFRGRVSFESSVVKGALILGGATFHAPVVLKNANTKRLVLGDAMPFRQDSADMRQWCFDVYEGHKSQWPELVGCQDPSRFSRDPYLQLESFYRRIDDSVEADDIHYSGRAALRRHALRERRARRARGSGLAFRPSPDAIRWGRWRLFNDWLLKWLTGYGVETQRLLIPIFLFVAVGALVFWPDNALRVRPPRGQAAPAQAAPAQTAQGEPAQAQVIQGRPAQTQPAQAQEAAPPAPDAAAPKSFGRKLFDKLAYSVDLFLPVVDLQQTDRWQPHGLAREIYSILHITAGWLLIPLLLASLSGVVKRH